MSLSVVSCVSVNYDHDGYITQYRTIKDTPAMDSELCLGLGELLEGTIRKLDAIPEPECRRSIADIKQRFIQKRDNSIRRRLAEPQAQVRTEKPHPKRKQPDRERS